MPFLPFHSLSPLLDYFGPDTTPAAYARVAIDPTPTSSPFAPPPGGATEYLFGCVVLALSEYAQIGVSVLPFQV
jgi:hypothetical protein